MSRVVLILLLSSSVSGAVSVIYKRSGGEVVIPTGTAASSITSITWKHNEDIAVEWYGEEPSAYRHFNGHTTLNTLTGALTISGLTREHSGSYTAEVNNKVAGTTEVQVISPVPKPTVSKRCDDEMTSCTLTCEGNTTDAEPVTYSWQKSDVHNYHEGQQVNITKENPEPWFRCEMKNPISAETSEEFSNPFSSGSHTLIIVLVLIFLILLLAGLVGFFIYRKWKSKKGAYSPAQGDSSKTPESNNQTENAELHEGSRNGVAPSLSVEETSTLIPKTSSVVLDTSSQTAMLNASNPDKTSEKPNDEPENSPNKEEEIEVQVHSPETPESNDPTENSPKKEEMEVQVHGPEPPESNDPSENSPKKEEEIEVQVHDPETPESNDPSENSPKEEKEIEIQIHGPETPESNDPSENSPKKEEEIEVQVHVHGPESNDPTEESAEESNGKETTGPLLEERNQSISVSA